MRIVSVFLSVDGECTLYGPLRWTVFVRVGGCNLRCYNDSGGCDTPTALDIKSGKERSIKSVVEEIKTYYPCSRVTITGGEPLRQKKAVIDLAGRLHQLNYLVTLETNGSIWITPEEVMCFDCVILDLKAPSTRMHKKNVAHNVHNLRRQDYIKIVIQDKEDYRWAKKLLPKISGLPTIAFGPRWGYLDPKQLIEWLRRDKKYAVMINLQLHKYIWGEIPLGEER